VTKSNPGIAARIVAAIPCFNTQEYIEQVIHGCNKYVDEVLVIDDGSTDATAQVAKAAGASVISHDKNRGKGAAMKTAIRNAKADIIVFLDGDGQHNPEDIPKLLDPIIQEKADFVIGSRFLLHSKRISTPFFRKSANYIAAFTISIFISFLFPRRPFGHYKRSAKKIKNDEEMDRILDSNNANQSTSDFRILNGRFKWITDCTSGLRAGSADCCRKLDLLSNGYQIETEMILELAKNNFTIAEIPCSCIWKKNVSRLSIAKDGLQTLTLLIRKTFKSLKRISPNKSDDFEIIIK
jgi:glycosyltransferase involved in cell wall biosynthesis